MKNDNLMKIRISKKNLIGNNQFSNNIDIDVMKNDNWQWNSISGAKTEKTAYKERRAKNNWHVLKQHFIFHNFPFLCHYNHMILLKWISRLWRYLKLKACI